MLKYSSGLLSDYEPSCVPSCKPSFQALVTRLFARRSPVLGVPRLPLYEVLVHDARRHVPCEHHLLGLALVAADPEAGGRVSGSPRSGCGASQWSPSRLRPPPNATKCERHMTFNQYMCMWGSLKIRSIWVPERT